MFWCFNVFMRVIHIIPAVYNYFDDIKDFAFGVLEHQLKLGVDADAITLQYGKGDVKKQDYLKLKVYYATALEKFELAKKGLILAKGAVLLQMGYPQTEPIEIKDSKIEGYEYDNLKELYITMVDRGIKVYFKLDENLEFQIANLAQYFEKNPDIKNLKYIDLRQKDQIIIK